MPLVKMRVVAAQIPVTADLAGNVAAIDRAIRFAAGERADLLVTPEGSLSGYQVRFDAAAVTRALDRLVTEASRNGIALAVGTCAVEPDDGKTYNELRIYNRRGKLLGYHAKILLCKDETDAYAVKPLRAFDLDGVKVGALVCNDLWCNPEFTVQDDPHLSQKLADMGAKLIVHAANSGLSRGNEGEIYRQYHDANLRVRARAGKIWIVTADACDAAGQMISNAPSGIVDHRGKWVARAPDRGERFVSHTVEL